MPPLFSRVFRLRRAARSLRIGLAAVLSLTLSLAAGGLWTESHARSAAAAPLHLPPASVPGPGQRVLVFAPHPDDEVLGVGGLLFEARRRGADVRVVYFTSGDGFPLCAAARYHSWPDQASMCRLAGDRRSEARNALAALGVRAPALTFLGYPDRGLSTLWLDRWTREPGYRSRFTNRSCVPAPATFHPGAPYCGQSVLEDVEALLRQTQPDFVYYSDGADDHPDHWAAHCFVEMALERLRREPWARRAVRRTYLIHRGAWPKPLEEDEGLYLAPPRALSGLDLDWEMAALSPEAMAAKRKALHAYGSQQAVSGNFLTAFLRRNELLAGWREPLERMKVEGGRMKDEGGRRVIGHHSAPPQSAVHNPQSQVFVLPDSTRDRWGRARCRQVDFTAVEVQVNPDEVWLRARLRGPSAAWPAYQLYWKAIDGPPEATRTHRYRISGYRCAPPDTRFAIRGSEIEVRLSRSELPPSGRIMVAAEAWSGPVLLDRTSWRALSLDGSGVHPFRRRVASGSHRQDPPPLETH
jgi:LmbE family N-acetylglucosaminyl deacetylase